MTHFADTFRTPMGLFSIAVRATGAVVATAFGSLENLRARFETDHISQDAAAVRRARDCVLAYFEGEYRNFDLPLEPGGTVFQRRVWAELSQIPFGETRSYGQIAARLGNPTASRAVGRANATNPICLAVPCHRVIGADGSLTGFAFGEDIKRRRLEHEQAVVARTARIRAA